MLSSEVGVSLCVTCTLEYFFVRTFSSSILYLFIFSEVPNHNFFGQFLISVACILIVCLYFVTRYSSTLKMSVKSFFYNSDCSTSSLRIPSLFSIIVVSVQAVGVLIRVMNDDTGMFSLDNLKDDGVISYRKIFTFLLSSPIVEEFTFRGLMGCILKNTTITSTRQSLLSGLLFSLVHAHNYLNIEVHKMFALAQMILAGVLGVLYYSQFRRRRSIVEPLFMHFANNLISCFHPMKAPTLDNIFPLVMSFVVFGSFAYHSLTLCEKEEEMRMKKKESYQEH